MKCAICKGEKFKKISMRVRDSSRYKIVKCQNCNLLQLSPRPSVDEDRKFYDQNRQSKNIGEPTDLKIIRKKHLQDTIRRGEMVSRYVQKNNTILDIGSGYGFFLEEMYNRGYDITGVEISEEGRRISSKVTNVKVLNINLYENDTDLPIFDCITLFHVLEHVNDPIRFLKIIKKHLNNNGKLIIEVPNTDDILLDACKEYRDFFWQRAHLFYFNAETLKKIIQKAGFLMDNIFYVHRYSIENFMNWYILGKPQIKKPKFQTKSSYKWLEDYYKKHLCEIGKSDILILIAKLKSKQKNRF